MKKYFFIAIILFSLTAKSQELLQTPAQKQIEEYTKQLEDCEKAKKDKVNNNGSQLEVKLLSDLAPRKRDFTIADDDMVIGNPKSKVVVIEYFAPTCPHCFMFFKRSFPRLKAEYIDTNRIAYVFREFIGNKQDLDASLLARCKGDVNNYLKFVEVLLSQQENWAFSKKYQEILANIGALGGVNAEEYAKCIKDERLNKILMDNTKLPSTIPGFIGTPTFFINGQHFTKPYTFEQLTKAIEEELAK